MRLSPRSPVVWVSVAVALAAAGVYFAQWRGPQVRTTGVTRRSLEQHVVASGRVRVQTRVQIAAQTPGLVVAVAAVEGQRVKAGELLVQIDDAEARTAVAQANAAVDQAKARVEQLRRVGSIVATEALRQADAKLASAEADLARAAQLTASGAIAKVELENAQRALDVARAQRGSAEAQQLSSTPLGADSRVALTALLAAEAQLTGAKVRLSQTRILALQDGLVLTRSVEPGDVVQPTRTLLVMAADNDAELVVQPDERNLAFVALGQRAQASADAYPAQLFEAMVSYIAPSVDPQRGSVEVRLRVPSPPPFLKPDMTVSVDLTVASKQGVLTVPSDAVHAAATPTPWVLVVDSGKLRKKNVHLGIRGEGSVEIEQGLAEGEAVVMPDGKSVVEGQRVRGEAG